MTLDQQKAIALASARARAAEASQTQAPVSQPNQTAQRGPVMDVLNAIPGGLAKGFAAIGGLPGDLRELGGTAIGALSNAVGGDGTTARSSYNDSANRMYGSLMGLATGDPNLIGLPVPMPTTGQLNDTVSKPFGGYYKPQMLPGQYAETIASFAPNALAPGSLPQKVLRAVVPGAASETAGQATKGTKAEPYARAAGAIAGGVGLGLAESAVNASKAMTMEELAAAKGAAYKAANDAGVVISPQSFQKFATDFGADLTKNNVVQADVHKGAMSALNILQDEAASGAPISLERADMIRKAIKGAVGQAAANNSDDLRIAMKVKSGLDNYLDNLAPADTLSGDATIAVPILKEARGLAQRQFKAEKIQELIDLAKNDASTNYSASGLEQAIRRHFKNFNAELIKDPSMAKGFTAAEREAIQRVAEGGPVGNVMRYFGKLAPTGVVSGGAGVSLGAMAGGAIGGPVGAAIGATAVPTFGALNRMGATALTQRNAAMAEELMRAGGNAANPGATGLPQSVFLSPLLSQAHR